MLHSAKENLRGSANSDFTNFETSKKMTLEG